RMRGLSRCLYVQAKRALRPDREVVVSRLAVDQVFAFGGDRMKVRSLRSRRGTLFLHREKQPDIFDTFFTQLLRGSYLGSDYPFRITRPATKDLFIIFGWWNVRRNRVHVRREPNTRSVGQCCNDIVLVRRNRL